MKIKEITQRFFLMFSKREEISRMLDKIDDQDLSRFSQEDIILETTEQIKDFLPEVLGQALARTWVDKRFLNAFTDFPIQVLDRRVYFLTVYLSSLPRRKSRPKVIVYEMLRKKEKILEELIMVAEE